MRDHLRIPGAERFLILRSEIAQPWIFHITMRSRTIMFLHQNVKKFKTVWRTFSHFHIFTFSHVYHVHHVHHVHHFEVKIEFFRNESVLIVLNWFITGFITVQSGGVMVTFG